MIVDARPPGQDLAQAALYGVVGLELGSVPADLLLQVRLLGLEHRDAPPDRRRAR
jgi:hypothetical protein